MGTHNSVERRPRGSVQVECEILCILRSQWHLGLAELQLAIWNIAGNLQVKYRYSVKYHHSFERYTGNEQPHTTPPCELTQTRSWKHY